METQDTYYETLITRYLSGEATRNELDELEVWVKKDKANRQIFNEYYSAWKLLKQNIIETDTDLDAEWDVMDKKITGFREDARVIPMQQVIFMGLSLRQVLRIAALIILLLVPGYFLYHYLAVPPEKQLVASSDVLSGILPDGSEVTLNAGSTLNYPAAFRDGKRDVSLDGEGYFEVSHNKKKPFIITAGDMHVKVTGTSFYVNTRYGDKKMEVILNSGSVILYFDNDPGQGVQLKPGDCAEISTDARQIRVFVNEDPNYLAWKTRKIIFQNESLDKVALILNKVYHTNFIIAAPMLSSCRLTATFDNQPLPSVLKVLKATLDLNFKDSGQNIEITGKGCE